jgi:hypothetical protein
MLISLYLTETVSFSIYAILTLQTKVSHVYRWSDSVLQIRIPSDLNVAVGVMFRIPSYIIYLNSCYIIARHIGGTYVESSRP